MHNETIAIPLTCFMTGWLTNSRGISMATMIFNLCCGLVAPVRLCVREWLRHLYSQHTLELRAINRPLLPGKLASILEWSSLPGPATLVADECRSQLAIHPSKYEHARGVASRVSKASTMGDTALRHPTQSTPLSLPASVSGSSPTMRSTASVCMRSDLRSCERLHVYTQSTH
jgi:hypothetical protein